MIEIKDLSKQFKNERVIRYRDYTFEDGKTYLLLGASGCGKSTLLNMIAGILNSTTGKVFIDGRDMSSLSQKEKDLFRIQNIGYIFQDFKLIEGMTVQENIDILQIEGVDTSRTGEILDKLGMLEYKKKKIKNLSGGQKQRVAIARALVKEPRIILGDEPTGNLNFEIGETVIRQLLEAARGKMLLVVSHDDRLSGLFDYVIYMDDFIVKEEG